MARQAPGWVRSSNLRWVQPSCAVGHRRSRRSSGAWTRPAGGRRATTYATGGGGGTGISDDDQKCRLLPSTRIQQCKSSETHGIKALKSKHRRKKGENIRKGQLQELQIMQK